MKNQEHSVITFLKNHGKDIIKKERYKYEPIKKKEKMILDKNPAGENIYLNDREKTPEYLCLKLDKQEQQICELKIENTKLKSHTNEEWYNKYIKIQT